MEKTILVTGGAGYIGSAAVKELIEKKFNVLVADNLSKGDLGIVDKKAKFFKVDLTDKEELEKIFKNYKIDSVMHFAAYKAVGESMENPEKYFDNIQGTINLLELMANYEVKKIIYSSSAAVYGLPNYTPVDENHPTKPTNYYGFTKKVCEELIEWYSKIYNLSYICLRYFNVAGDALNYIDPGAENVFPILMEAIFGKREKFCIFGKDYDTRDGTCIRDYIDVKDLVKAHISALNVDKNEIINLGTSIGVSVKELVSLVKEVTGADFKVEIAGKRKGDVSELIASNEKAKKLLNWSPETNVKEMISSTYKAYKRKFNVGCS